MRRKEALVGSWVGLALALAVDGAAAAQNLRAALDAVVRGEAREASARGDERFERLVQAVTGQRSPVFVQVTGLQSLPQRGCRRVRIALRAPEAKHPQTRVPFETAMEMNLCEDGLPPGPR